MHRFRALGAARSGNDWAKRGSSPQDRSGTARTRKRYCYGGHLRARRELGRPQLRDLARGRTFSRGGNEAADADECYLVCEAKIGVKARRFGPERTRIESEEKLEEGK